jgi:ABC-type sugar transport system ATPase subunit
VVTKEKVPNFYGSLVIRIGDGRGLAVIWIGGDAKELFYYSDNVLVCASYTQRFFDED